MFDIASWTMIGATIIWTVIIGFLFIFQCGTNFNAYWGTLQESQELYSDEHPIQTGFTVTDVSADLVILVLPIPIVWHLQMPVRRRLAILVVLLLGSTAIAASMFHMVLFAEILSSQYLSHPTYFGLPATDLVGIESIGVFWSLVEMGVAVPVACLSTLRPMLYRQSRKNVIGSIRSIVSPSYMFSDKRKNLQGSYELRSRTGDFEMRSGARGTEETGFVEPHGSQDEDVAAIMT